jgi:signal transduction histidine kinase
VNVALDAATATGKRQSPRNPLRLLISREPWLALVFMLLSFVLGVFWFVTLVTLLSTGFGLAITLVGLPLLVVALLLWIQGARLERLRVGALLGVPIRDPYRPLPRGPRTFIERLKVRLFDRHTWLDLLYLFLLFPIGIAEFVIATVVVSVPFTLLAAPTYYWAGWGPDYWPDRTVDTFPEALIAAAIGFVLLLLLPYVLVGAGRGHAWLARNLLGTNREAELAARVGQLTESRSRAMDVSVSELQRIERDLHDGAQQRLVKLSMDLGRAREKLASDPAGAQALVDEAHEEAKRAMLEIRNLARGIHPAVLTDRGLDPAISALASRSPVPVTVDVTLNGRLPGAVESTAYFVVAESLTNIARHSGATEARVGVQQVGDRLLLDISDNGKGGADPARGSGLTGLVDRVAAFDGTLTIDSPPGGPTRVHVELPCESSSPKIPSSSERV